jgi:DNA polymerase
MPSESTNNELASLLKDTREQLTYFHELGVENIEITQVPPSSTKTVPVRVPDRLTAKPAPRTATPEGAHPPARVSAAPLVPAVPDSQQRDVATPQLPPLFGDLDAPAVPLPRSTETFKEIWADIGDCTRCPLFQGRKNIVHTDGDHRARLMFVGEAPGADEDAQGRPFVGRAGQLLTKIIEAIGFKREEVLIGNVNRCRPPANRPPTAEEAAMCKPFLLREIAAVRPEVIVVLGNTAMKNLLDTKVGITKLRGDFQDFQGAKVMPTFHPAYLLRDPSKKQETWADLKKVRDYLESTRKRTN